MAKIVVEIDSEEETMIIKVGGEVVEGASSFWCEMPNSMYGSEMHMSFYKTEETEDDIRKTTTYSLASMNETKKKLSSGEMVESEYKGFAKSMPEYPMLEKLTKYVSERLLARKNKKR